ncbi:MAG: rhomboid family intramembrane serine protease [Firmicutes bacterium]|nr:rhomboid family intramembrane serine protease [Bacillota bacterium]
MAASEVIAYLWRIADQLVNQYHMKPLGKESPGPQGLTVPPDLIDERTEWPLILRLYAAEQVDDAVLAMLGGEIETVLRQEGSKRPVLQMVIIATEHATDEALDRVRHFRPPSIKAGSWFLVIVDLSRRKAFVPQGISDPYFPTSQLLDFDDLRTDEIAVHRHRIFQSDTTQADTATASKQPHTRRPRQREWRSWQPPQAHGAYGTYFVLAVLVIVFVFEELAAMRHLSLITWGANSRTAIADGQWWRLFTSVLLHLSIWHLLFNGLALYWLGTATEQIYGTGRFLWLFIMSGLVGSLLSVLLLPPMTYSAGASGAIFGMFGALLYFGSQERRLFRQTIGPSVIFWLVFNLFFSFANLNIDVGGHIGGLIGGFLAAAACGLPSARRAREAVGICLIFTLLYVGAAYSSIHAIHASVAHKGDLFNAAERSAWAQLSPQQSKLNPMVRGVTRVDA